MENRKTFNKKRLLVKAALAISSIYLVCLTLWACIPKTLTLENSRLGLSFDRETGALVAIWNKLTDEIYYVSGDEFMVEAVEFGIDFSQLKSAEMKLTGDRFVAHYEGKAMNIEVTWTLDGDHNFAEKRMTLTTNRDYGLKKVVLSRPTFAADGLNIVSYRYPQFGRAVGKEPICTFFGRTSKGGFFTGIEMPFDASSLSERQVVLAYAPSIKVKAGERIVCEPVYFGIYQRHTGDDQPNPMMLQFIEKARREFQQKNNNEVLPLQSESDAMNAMTSAILGPPRHDLVPMACGWHSEMQHGTYTSDKMVGEEMRSLDFLAECGIDWVSDSHPWGGETEKMNALGANDKYMPGELVTKFLEHAQKKEIKVMMWPTMNNTHPWSVLGEPFRADKPEWLMMPGTLDDKPDFVKKKAGKANCFANAPFFNWLSRINDEGLATGHYKGWCMDGSFFGDGGWYTSVIPVDCASDEHDHLPGDSNYACQKALDQLIGKVRQRYPQAFIEMCRPAMDLGVWSMRNADVCFTQLERGTGNDNLAAGDNIRTWSRARVHLDFFPHYIDQPLLFSSRHINDKRQRPFNWSSEKLDYILLSALSSSPNQIYYIPTKTGIPENDKAEIKKWLDWGRKNVDYLKVRKDLPDWPEAGKVDGSAHIIGNQGLIFLFNPNKYPLSGVFTMNQKDIGLKGKENFKITQQYPESKHSVDVRYGETTSWEVPPETAVILEIKPIDDNTQ
jgi:hypothetical protein